MNMNHFSREKTEVNNNIKVFLLNNASQNLFIIIYLDLIPAPKILDNLQQ